MDKTLSTLRGNKLVLYGGAGFVGGVLGSLLGEIMTDQTATTKAGVIALNGLTNALIATVLTVVLFTAVEWHQRRQLRLARLAKIAIFGAIAGFVAGAAGQALYNLAEPGFFKFYVLRVIGWALSGLLLGAILSRRIPNLGLSRGAIAGTLGGAIGCIGAIITWENVPSSAEFIGRVVGYGLQGLAIGLAIHMVENMLREASIEVEWAPNETTFFSLGSTPVTVGGGEDHIFIRGLPENVSSIFFQNGQIEHIETSNGKKTLLDDGSRLRIGGHYMVVHAAK